MIKDILKNKNLIPLTVLIAGFLIAGAIIYSGNGKNIINDIINKTTKEEVSPKITEKVINYINKNILAGRATASVKETVKENGLYKMVIKINEEEYPIYISPDGKILFLQGINLEEDLSFQKEGNSGEANQGITKTEKPDVKIFVMSYCPYGLQAEKMFLPVYDLLKEKVNFGIYFVNYLMHGKVEMEENLIQYCIEKEQKERYRDYLECFVNKGNTEQCQTEAKIDKGKLNNCISITDKEFKISEKFQEEDYPPFDVHKDLNEKYNVRGSPTIVINDKVVNVYPRSPQKFKEAICQAFKSVPEECKRNLSEETASPGFGAGTGSSASGGCGQ